MLSRFDLRKNWLRVVGMSRHEVQTRARQVLGKRVDLAMNRLRLCTNIETRNPVSSKGGSFFFLSSDIPRISALFREHFAEDVKAILREADEICAHRFRLLGYGLIDYGQRIDWHLDPIHGKRAPFKPWYKIPYLDVSKVGDHKVIWELNRHQHLVTLAKACVLSGNYKYAEELENQWYAWKRDNPFLYGINWSSSLEVSFRSLSWLWVRYLLADCGGLPANFQRDLLGALALNAEYIEKYLSTYFSPNTHLLGEGVGLFFIGTLCPGLRRAARWKKLGLDIVLQAAQTQVRADGVYFEQSLYYHVYALDFLLYSRLLAARNGTEIPVSFDAVLGKMLDVLRVLSQAGPPNGFGDDDGGRVFDPRRNHHVHLTDPLALGALLFDRDDLRAASSLTEESVWLFGEMAIANWPKTSTASALKPAAFESTGIYVLASSNASQEQMVIDAGPFGTGSAGHAHADALSITVSAGGRPWLVDPGTFSYVHASEDRNGFRGTAAHNTVSVDGLHQAIPAGPFAWSNIPDVQVERWLVGESFTTFTGSHTGYYRLRDPVLHRRIVVHIYGKFWLVRDLIEGRSKHLVESFWHFSSAATVREKERGFVAEMKSSRANCSVRLGLLPAHKPGWSYELGSGRVSAAYGQLEAAVVLRIGGQVNLPCECATLIVPLVDETDERRQFDGLYDPKNELVHAYRYDALGVTHYFVWSDGKPWIVDSWASDAAFLYGETVGRKVTHFILCDGSYANFRGQPLYSHSRTRHFESMNGNVFTARDTAIASSRMVSSSIGNGAVR